MWQKQRAESIILLPLQALSATSLMFHGVFFERFCVLGLRSQVCDWIVGGRGFKSGGGKWNGGSGDAGYCGGVGRRRRRRRNGTRGCVGERGKAGSASEALVCGFGLAASRLPGPWANRSGAGCHVVPRATQVHVGTFGCMRFQSWRPYWPLWLQTLCRRQGAWVVCALSIHQCFLRRRHRGRGDADRTFQLR